MSLKWFVLAGTFSTSIIFTSIGLAMHYELYHKYMFLVLQILNGIAQASAWPGLLCKYITSSELSLIIGSPPIKK